jgi:hypothetical protein
MGREHVPAAALKNRGAGDCCSVDRTYHPVSGRPLQ